MNTAAAEVVSQLIEGTEVESIRKVNAGARYTVSHISEKSVHFTNGQYENKRSMFHYRVVS